MRVIATAVFASLILISLPDGVLAKEAVRSIGNATELSDIVNHTFAKKDCVRISEVSMTGSDSNLAMQFRFRCEGVVDDVLVLLNELKEVEGLVVEEVVNYPSISPKNNRPSVDVRFDAIALGNVEG